MSPIIDLQRRLVEVGRLRMGHQVPYQKDGETKHRAAKLDHWRLTSRDKLRLEAAADLYGGEVRPWAEREGEFELFTETAELGILLLPGQTLSQWHEVWSAGGCQRRCDGVQEILTDSPCICDSEPGDRACKPTTRLSVMLPDVPGLGCWRLESHGYYAAVELSATAVMLERATALGQLLPARLRIDQRSKVEAGKTTRYAVPVIDIDTTPRHALSMGQGEEKELAYTPAARELFAVTVEDGLDAASQSGAPRAIGGRSAAPIPPADDGLEFGEPLSADSEPEPPAVESPSAPAAATGAVTHEPSCSDTKVATARQKKALDVLVGTLRDNGHITTQHLYRATRHDLPAEGEELHWSTLREQLSKEEASSLIERLERLEENVREQGGSEFAAMAGAAQERKGAA